MLETERLNLLPAMLDWGRRNLFATPRDGILTILGVALSYYTITGLIGFAVTGASWSGGPEACEINRTGACWPFVAAKFEQFLYGGYPRSEYWRPNLVMLLFFALVCLLAYERTPGRRLLAVLALTVYPVLSVILLLGFPAIGIERVMTSSWGGFLLTLVIAATGIVFSLPLGILFALGRRSSMPVLRILSIVFIEFWRGVPLITVLFMSSFMFPLFLPEGKSIDALLRALIGVSLFSAAYMAEVVRGGLQSLPKGQFEAADALGLAFWKKMYFIALPQALKVSIPSIVNTFIGLFKDTTLVAIVSLLDLLGRVQTAFSDPVWGKPTVSFTGYLFVAVVFWVFCYAMSRYSRYYEFKYGIKSY